MTYEKSIGGFATGTGDVFAGVTRSGGATGVATDAGVGVSAGAGVGVSAGEELADSVGAEKVGVAGEDAGFLLGQRTQTRISKTIT